jgi:hypothetical protein
MRRRSPKADTTRRPEAEKAFLAGLLELLPHDPPRCREALALVEPAALTIEAGPKLLLAITQTAALEAPTGADLARIIRERAIDAPPDRHPTEFNLMADLAAAVASNRGAYSLGVDRHAHEIMRAATRRRTIEAAAVATALAADPGANPAEIEAAGAAVAAASASGPAERLEWEPFPVELLPDPVGAFVAEAAERLSTDPVLVAFPMLASIAATIGNRRRIELWEDWREPPILWLAGVAAPGSMKTPAADKALQFIRQRQHEAFIAHDSALADYEAEKREHDRASRRRDAEPTAPPERPVAERALVDDITIEALGPILQDNPNGLLVARDELSGWFDFDRYSGGKGGGEVGRWLSCYGAAPLTVDRKLSGTFYVPAAAVSITGTIQPKVLARVIGSKHIDNGLLQRFILAAPPRRMKEIPSGDVDFATVEAVRSIFKTLATIRPAEDGSPLVLDLEPEAAEAWETFYKEHAAAQFNANGPAGEMLSKAEAWAARLALVFHMIRQAGSEPTLGHRIDPDSIRRGIGLARWAAREWQRVFEGMERGSIEADDLALREWLRGRGGVATARDVARQGPAAYRAPGAAEAGLQRLTKMGAAEWQTITTGGRPADAVRLR